MVRDNQLDQYFRFVKDMLLEEVISDPLIYSAYYVNQNWSTIQSNTAIVHDNSIIYCWFVLIWNQLDVAGDLISVMPEQVA